MREYISKLFDDHIMVALSATGAFLYRLLFPESAYLYGAMAVTGIFMLDLATRLYAEKRKAGGWAKAIKTKHINSRAFGRGTMDKLIVFIVMLIACGLAYHLTMIHELATWFTQLVFTLMFLRDVLSILENLGEAGIDVGIFRRAVKKKMQEYTTEEDENND